MTTPPDDPDLDAERRARHDAAVAKGRAYYVDPRSGLQVLTAAFLRRQGRCCERGCRHCPYPEAGASL